MNWELVTSNGYTFEFEHKKVRNVTVQVIADSEKNAWRKLWEVVR